MRFSLVTPVMNGMPYVAECVQTIDAQRDDVDVEHLVYDAGSTDGTREWLRAHAERARLTFESDRGQIDALEKGFAAATGDVLGWLNADDLLERHALARVRDAFQKNPDAVAVSGACLFVDADGAAIDVVAPPRRAAFDDLLRAIRNLTQPSTFFRAAAFARAGGFDRTLTLAFDADLFRRIARIGAIVTLPGEVLARFRVHAASKTEQNHALSAREDLRSRRRLGMPLASPAALTLAKRGYVYPLLPRGALPLARRVVGALKGT